MRKATRLSRPDVSGLVVERGVLRDGIIKTLEGAIIRGQLKPGQKLSEKLLAEQLKVSRAPLREAFLKLEEKGLVTKRPHQGAVVMRFTARDVLDIYTVRIPLEGFAARLMAEGGSREEEVRRVRRAYDRMVQIGEEEELSSYLQADFEFHRTIWEASGNRRLLQILTQLCAPFFRFSEIQAIGFGKSFSTARAASEHLPIVEALEHESPEAVEKTIRKVIGANRHEFIQRCYDHDGGASLMPGPWQTEVIGASS
jgi:DNA-binding GntR family transcriptional regulator